MTGGLSQAGLSSRLALLLTFLLAVGASVHSWWFWDSLPSSVASHFDFHGKGDWFMPKTWFVVVYLGSVFMMAILSVASAVRAMRRGPGKVPNRAYWTHPERKAGAGEFVAFWSLVNGILVSSLLIWLFHEAFLANIAVPSSPSLPSRVFVGLGVEFILLGSWLSAFFVRFKLPKGASEEKKTK